jgi:hypothetical protein
VRLCEKDPTNQPMSEQLLPKEYNDA